MSSKSSTSLILAIFAGLILGGLLGYFLPDTMLSLSFVGQLFINALRIVVIPVIIASLIVGVAALADLGRVNRATGKTLLYFGVTSAIAVIIGFALTEIIQPGAGVNTAGAVAPGELTRVTSFSFTEMLGSILPENLLGATAQGQFLGLVIFSLFFGATLIAVGDRGKVVVSFFQSVNEVLMRLVRLLLYAAPVGILFLVATAVAQNADRSTRLISSVGIFSLTVLAAFVIQGLIVLPLALKLFGNRPFGKYLADSIPALATAFGTGSAAATLPVTYKCIVEDSDVDERAGAMTLPLGAMINMNGTAMYLVIGAFFCAQAFAVDLSWLQVLTILGATFLLSIGASLLPYGSLLILGVVLFSAGFPPQAFAAIGLILIVDWFFERLRATLNVWGDVVGAAVIGETFEFKTARRVGPVASSRRTTQLKRGNGAKRQERKSSSQDKRRQDPKDRKPRRDTKKRDERGDRSGGERRDRSKGDRRDRSRSGRDDRSRGDRNDRNRRNGGRPERRERDKRADSKRTTTPQEKAPKEKSTSFEMPKPPYHVLDNELRSRKGPNKPDSDIQQKTVAAMESEREKEILSQETVERERAKIAAQLAELGHKEKPADETISSDQNPEATVEPVEQPEPVALEKPEPEFPRVDFYSEDAGETPVEESTPEPAEETRPIDTAEPVSEPPDNAPAKSYGRSKSRRGAAVKNRASAKEPAEPTEPKEDTKPEFSSENISFGRSKRKKPGS